MKVACLIPARMGSSRFPGKPLKEACGLPMILHVAKRCALATRLDYLAVATCDEEICEVCERHGIQVVMTADVHERCTDRVREAVQGLDIGLQPTDCVVMVQGDEILVYPEMIEQVIDAYEKTSAPAINLLSKIDRSEDHEDPNVVKVVVSLDGKALYLSRAPIPSYFRNREAPVYQQTGVMAFSVVFLERFSDMPQTPLERTESIDMLRILEHGLSLHVVYTDKEVVPVDTEEDLKRAERMLEKDPLLSEYAENIHK